MPRKRRGRGEGSVHQRDDGLWACTLSLGYTNAGKRRRKTLYGKTKAEVQKKLRDLQAKADIGDVPESSKETVAAFLARWLDDVVRVTLSPNTHESYECVVRCHVSRLIGGAKLAKLTAPQVQGMYSAMEKEGASPRTRELAHAVLHRALRQAVRWGILPANPADGVDRPKVPKRPMNTLTQEQTIALLSAAKGHRLYALFVLAVASGMRQGELFGLQWDDIDLKAATINVQRSLEEIDGDFRLKPPKSARGRRQVDLPAFAVEALRDHRKLTLAEGHAGGPVFCSRGGTWLYKSNFTRSVFKAMLRKAGLPDVRFHDLRHGHATLMLELGENPKVVQERLGHSQISLTLDTYSHVMPAIHKRAASNIDQAFAKGRAKATKKRRA